MNRIKIYLFCKDRLIEWKINSSLCKSIEFCLDKCMTLFSEDYVFSFEYDGDNYKLSSNNDYIVSVKGKNLDSKIISDGDVLVCNFLRENSKVILLVQFEEDTSSIFYKFPIKNLEEITIGSSDYNDIVYKNENVLDKHLILNFTNKPNVKSIGNAAGCYVNGVRFLDFDLKFGDVIFLYGLKCVYLGDYIALNDPNKNVYSELTVINNEEVDKLSPRRFTVFDKRILNNDKVFLDFDEEKTVVINPPRFTLRYKFIFLYVLCALCLGFIILEFILYQSIFLNLASVCALSALVVGGVILVVNSLKGSQKLKKYSDYLDEKNKEISLIKYERSRGLNQRYPNTIDCYKIVTDFDKRLWERNSTDKHFLSLVISQGKIHFENLKIVSDYSSNLNEEHQLYQNYLKLLKNSNTLKNAPIIVPLKEVSKFAVVGDMSLLYEVFKNFIVQMTSIHSPNDLKLAFIYSKNYEKNIDYIKELPHVYSNKKDFRYLASNEEEFTNLIYEIKNIILEREMALSLDRDQKFETSYVVYLFYENNSMINSFLEFMESVDRRVNVSVILFTIDNKFVPNNFKYILEVDTDKQILYRINSGQIKKLTLSHDYVGSSNLVDINSYVSILGRMKLFSKFNSNNHVDIKSIFDLYDASNLEELMILNRWNRNKLITTKTIPLGVQEDGSIFSINMHNKVDGSNGIILGESSSGKTEFLKTLIMSYSINFNPSEINFLILKSNYNIKLNDLIDLPHVVDILDKNDESEKRRVVSLIKNEILRRKNLFGSVRVNDISAYSNIRNNYIDAPEIQHLVLVLDDINEKDKLLIKELTDMCSSLSEVGIHLLVSSNDIEFFSQKVFDITSRFDFKICFKLSNIDDMFKIIGNGEVINPLLPGIFNISFSHSRFLKNVELTYIDVVKFVENEYEIIDLVDNCGLVTKKVSKANYLEEGIEEQNSIINFIVDISKNFKYETINIFNSSLRYLSLQELVGYDSKFNGFMWCNHEKECSAIIGVIDDPDYRVQRFLEVNFKEKGNLFIYGSHGTGKSTLIKTIVYSLCCEYKADYINIYMVDLNTRNTGYFSYLPHVKDIAYSKEEVNVLFKKVLDEFDLRKKIFENLDISSVETYRAKTGDVLPYVVLFIDSIQDIVDNVWEYTNFIKMLARDGSSYGIYVCIASSEYSQDEIKLSEYFNNKFVLRLNDESIYEKLLGESCKVNSKFKGRGLVRYEDSRGSRVLEFQVAYPMNCENEVELNNKLRSLFIQMRDINNKIYESSCISKVLESCKENLDMENTELLEESKVDGLYKLIKEFKNFPNIFSLIYKNKIGVEEVMKNIIDISTTPDDKIYLLDNTGEGFKELNGEKITWYSSNKKEISQFLSWINVLIKERIENNEFDVNDNDKFYILIPDIHFLIQKILEEEVDLLNQIFSNQKDIGIYFIISFVKGVDIDEDLFNLIDLLLEGSFNILLDDDCKSFTVYKSEKTYLS